MTAGCAVAVERYGLSRREAEVLDPPCRGRDVPYVAEELVISKNTVRTHTKSIFAKNGGSFAPGAYRPGGVHRSVSTFLPNANFASRKVLRAPLAICPAVQRNASRETFLHWISPVENTSF